MTQRERYLNTSLSKALRVLELFDNVHPEFTLTEIAEALDGRPGSIYPIVYTLRQFGFRSWLLLPLDGGRLCVVLPWVRSSSRITQKSLRRYFPLRNFLP